MPSLTKFMLGFSCFASSSLPGSAKCVSYCHNELLRSEKERGEERSGINGGCAAREAGEVG